MKLVVTGATGYIGARLLLLASKQGHEVVAASRKPPHGASWLPFDLASRDPIVFPPGTNVVIHLAADTTSVAIEDSDYELLAARLLIAAAQKVAAKVVFISSQVARPDAPTAYGRTKWRIEQEVLSADGWVVRPGLVYGGCERGLFGTLVGAVRRLPVIPAFLPAPKVQPIHVDDLTEGLLRIAVRDDIEPGIVCLASNEPVSFTRFLMIIASVRLRRRRWLVPVPVILIQAVGLILGMRLRVRLGFERLNSLFDFPLMDTANDLHRLGLSLRSLHSGMHRSGNDRRRRLIYEGKALLTYLLKDRPGVSLLRRYVYALEKLRGGFPLNLPSLTLRLPIILALLDDKGFALSSRGAEFGLRLDMATVLAEATIPGARRFLDLGRVSGALTSMIRLSYPVFAEIFWRILRMLCMPFLRRSMREQGECQ